MCLCVLLLFGGLLDGSLGGWELVHLHMLLLFWTMSWGEQIRPLAAFVANWCRLDGAWEVVGRVVVEQRLVQSRCSSKSLFVLHSVSMCFLPGPVLPVR